MVLKIKLHPKLIKTHQDEDIKPKFELNREFVTKNVTNATYSNWPLKVLASEWFGRWIPNPGIPGSKGPGGSKVDSSFYLFQFNQIITRNSWRLNCLIR